MNLKRAPNLPCERSEDREKGCVRMTTMMSRAGAVLCCLAAIGSAGCATTPYRFGTGWEASPVAENAPANPYAVEVVEGEPNRFVDGCGWVLGIPNKIMLWDRRADSHDVSAETEAAVVEYLARNHLEDVCVRVNQYAPLDEWQRLRENHHMSPGWRYSAGTLSLVVYTVLPGRLFGGDRYNPYTNTVYVYSDAPPLPMEAAAYAKDVHSRSLPGTYAVANELPGVSLWHETVATNDLLGYLAENGDPAAQKEGLQILHPRYGACVGGALDSVFGGASGIQFGGAILGHLSARREWARIEAERSQAQPVGPVAQPPQLSQVEEMESAEGALVQHEEPPVR